MARFSTAWPKFVPVWLHEGDGRAVLSVVNAFLDMTVERMRQALISRFPTMTGDTGLSLIGKDRGIPRGRTEVAAHYAERLKRWRWPKGHRVRGNAFAALEQVSEFWGGMLCQTRDDRGNTHTRTAAGVESWAQGDTWNWDNQSVDQGGTKWSRFWVLLFPNPDTEIREAPVGELQGAGHTLGQTEVTPDDIAAMRRLFLGKRQWKPAGTRAMFFVVDLSDASGGPNEVDPDGSWGTIAGRVAAQQANPNLRFWRISDNA